MSTRSCEALRSAFPEEYWKMFVHFTQLGPSDICCDFCAASYLQTKQCDDENNAQPDCGDRLFCGTSLYIFYASLLVVLKHHFFESIMFIKYPKYIATQQTLSSLLSSCNLDPLNHWNCCCRGLKSVLVHRLCNSWQHLLQNMQYLTFLQHNPGVVTV